MSNIEAVEALFILWIVASILVLLTKKVYRLIIFFGIFSLLSAVLFLFLGAPDVAMAEAAISAFATIFFIVCIEKYYSRGNALEDEEFVVKAKVPIVTQLVNIILPLAFTVGLFSLFIYFLPSDYVSTYLKNQYLAMFARDVGGENPVTSIYLGYRVYDTLFEALLLVAAVVAVSQMSYYSKEEVPDGKRSEIENSKMAKFAMRIICPIIIVFGVYLMANGHISAGGGFQGGLAIASFFICRFMVLNIYDLPIKKIMKMEEIVFINIAIIPVLAIFTGAVYFSAYVTPIYQSLYLIVMNGLIGFKVACGFFVLFYRYIAIERL